MNNKKIIDQLIEKGIEKDGEDFWFVYSEDALEYWENEINIEDFINDRGWNYIWINPNIKPVYQKTNLTVLAGETSLNGDWFINKIMDEKNQIIAMCASID